MNDLRERVKRVISALETAHDMLLYAREFIKIRQNRKPENDLDKVMHGIEVSNEALKNKDFILSVLSVLDGEKEGLKQILKELFYAGYKVQNSNLNIIEFESEKVFLALACIVAHYEGKMPSVDEIRDPFYAVAKLVVSNDGDTWIISKKDFNQYVRSIHNLIHKRGEK